MTAEGNDTDGGDERIVRLFNDAVARPVPPVDGGEEPPSRPARDEDDDCPVTCLGHADGQFWFLTPSGQVRGITDAKLNANGIRGLFEDRIAWLWDRFPRYDKAGEVKVGWGAAQAQEYLIHRCAQRGLFSVEDSQRADGAWLADDGRGLVVHCGDAVLVDGAWERPGRYGRWVYPARPAMPRPAVDGLSPVEVAEIRTLLQSWNWARPGIDPALLLGWIGCGVVCGALSWRPHVWLTGDKSVGKSWLHDLMRNLLGAALKSYANTTAAGVRDALKGAARPVALDELEAGTENDKADAVVELARIASQMGGSKGVRGSPTGDARYFSIDSVFVFGSILMPPLLPQDISRITQLDMLPVKATPMEALAIQKRIKAASALGGRLRRTVIDGWARWHDTLDMFSTALAEAGHPNRSANQYGALLAMYDLITGSGLPDRDSVDALVAQLERGMLSDQTDETSDHDKCLHHLLTADLEVYRHGEKRIVGEELMLALDAVDAGIASDSTRRLRNHGLALVVEQGVQYLAISNQHSGVTRLFAGTHWGAKSGRRAPWRQSLLRLEGARASTNNVKFGGVPSRALLIPIKALGLDMTPPSAPRSTREETL